MSIVLIGFMGSGKSTVAKHLSRLLGFRAVEMDELVYQKTNTQTMHEVFAKGGEILLRETEITIAKEYAPQPQCIISTGGGVVLNRIILDYFKKMGGKVFYLHACFETLCKRVEKDLSRPLFTDVTTAQKLYDFRLPLYLNYADQIFNTDFKSAEQIALEIKGSLDGL